MISPVKKAALKTFSILITVLFIIGMGISNPSFKHFVFHPVVMDAQHPQHGWVMLILAVVLFGALALIVYAGSVMAEKKNRRKDKWTTLCFLFNVWALLFLMFLPSNETTEDTHIESSRE